MRSLLINIIDQMEKETLEHLDNWLPPSDMSHAQSGGFYYKDIQRSRESDNLLNVRIGIRVYQFANFQEDHILYLIQDMNASLEWSHLTILNSNSIFLQTCLLFSPEQQISQEFISKERKLFHRLKKDSELISQMIQQELTAEKLLSESFDQEKMRHQLDQLKSKIKKKKPPQ